MDIPVSKAGVPDSVFSEQVSSPITTTAATKIVNASDYDKKQDKFLKSGMFLTNTNIFIDLPWFSAS